MSVPSVSTVLRMAGNIAGGLAANPAITTNCSAFEIDTIARISVEIAMRVITEVDSALIAPAPAPAPAPEAE